MKNDLPEVICIFSESGKSLSEIITESLEEFIERQAFIGCGASEHEQ